MAVQPNAALLAGLPGPMPSTGELATEWKRWRKRFEYYLKATRQADDRTPDDVKTSLLLHAIGEAGQEVYETLPLTFADKEKYAVVVTKFEEYYVPKKNITRERYRFFTRSQEPGETIDHYVTALRTLAQTCDFGGTRDSLIRDRLVLGVLDSRITKRLLSADDPPLDKALSICRAEEAAAAQQHRMNADAQRRLNVDAVQSTVMGISTQKRLHWPLFGAAVIQDLVVPGLGESLS